MGRERIPAVPPKLVTNTTRFTPTIIGSPVNAGDTAQTTHWGTTLCPNIHLNGSGGNFDWFWSSANLSLFCVSLATSANLLSSVIAIGKARLLEVIIVKTGEVSRLRKPSPENGGGQAMC